MDDSLDQSHISGNCGLISVVASMILLARLIPLPILALLVLFVLLSSVDFNYRYRQLFPGTDQVVDLDGGRF